MDQRRPIWGENCVSRHGLHRAFDQTGGFLIVDVDLVLVDDGPDLPVQIFSFFFGMYNGAMVAALTEVMPVYVRTVGFSLAFSLATAIFGGLTPAISTALVELTGDKSAPGWWLMCAALCGFIATALLFVRLSRGYQPAESQR